MIADLFYQLYQYLVSIVAMEYKLWMALIFFPMVLLLEIPFYLMLVVASIRKWLRPDPDYFLRPYFPMVTIAITAYAEKEDIYISLVTIYEQIYQGKIEVLVIVDGGQDTNLATTQCALSYIKENPPPPNIEVKVIPKKSRGGVAHSRNLALRFAKGALFLILDADTSLENVCVARLARHFMDEHVIGVAGGLKVRNEEDGLLCKLQSLEYRLAIELGRFGLSSINAMNIISGAFGIFRTQFLRSIKGWQNGAAEDLDLMMRIQAYTGRYPTFKIDYELDAIAYTEVPTTLKALVKQRLRWEGDLYYIYVRRHWRKFSAAFMGRWKSFMMAWYGLYYQIALPFVFCLYYFYVFIEFNLGVVLGVTFVIYLYYLFVTLFIYGLYLVLMSSQLRRDLKMLMYLPLMPIYQLAFRLLITFFILNEIIFKGHQETSVAPYWITKKTK